MSKKVKFLNDVIVNGDFTVKGATTTIDAETLTVADNMIVTNSLGNEIDSLSGLAIKKDLVNAYGIAYDNTDDTVKLGLGIINEDNEFQFNENEGQPIATRGNLVNGQLVEWDEEAHTLADAGCTAKQLQDEISQRVVNGGKSIDSYLGYQVDVPQEALSCAVLNKIGGMTYTSKNLIPYPYYSGATQTSNGITFTYNGGETVTVSGTATNKAYYILASLTPKNLRAGTYYINVGTNGAVQALIEGYQGSSWFSTIRTGNGAFTVDWNGYTSIRVMLYVYTGTTVSNVTIYPMLNEGATAKPYETYFEGLRSAKVTEIKSVGANLTTAKAVYSGADQYAEMVVDGRNCIRFTSGVIVKNKPITFKPNTQYTVSFYAKGENFGGAEISNLGFVFYYEDGTSSSVYVGVNAPWTLRTITSDSGKTVVSVGVYSREYRAYVYLDIDTFMFNEGTTALPYTPYTKNILPIPEAVQALNGYGDGVKESVYNYIDLEKKQFVKQVGKVDMGTLNWKLNGSETPAVFFASIADIVTSHSKFDAILCEGYKESAKSLNVNTMLTGTFTRGYSDPTLVFIKDEKFTNNVSGFASSVSGKMLYYELAEPIVTDVSDLITIDNLIDVESHGTITFENEYDLAIPSEVIFYEGTNDVVDASTFIGDLVGTAVRAISDKNGNDIAKTYATKKEAQLPTASATVKGGVKVGDGLSINSDGVLRTKEFAVRGEYLKGDNYYYDARSIDDLKSSSDVGFYIGDGYSLIVTEGSQYGDYNTIHQIKIVNAHREDRAPTIYIRQHNQYGGAGWQKDWTDWKEVGGVVMGQLESYYQDSIGFIDDDLHNATDVGFYQGDTYTLLVLASDSGYSDELSITQLKFTSQPIDGDGNTEPLVYYRSYNVHHGTWSAWEEVGAYELTVDDLTQVIPGGFGHTASETSEIFNTPGYYTYVSGTNITNPINMVIGDIITLEFDYINAVGDTEHYTCSTSVKSTGNSITIDFGNVTVLDGTYSIELYLGAYDTGYMGYELTYTLGGSIDALSIGDWSYTVTRINKIDEKYIPTASASTLGGVKVGKGLNIDSDGVLKSEVILSNSEIDTSIAYVKDVPADSASYAEVNKVGGMTRKCTNLLNPAWRAGETVNGVLAGVTITENANGSVTFNGTSTGDMFYDMWDDNQPIKAGTYYASLGNGFSGGKDVKEFAIGRMKKADNSIKYYVFSANAEQHIFTVTEAEAAETRRFIFRVRAYAGTVFNNETIYPMFAKSTTALPYEPYFEGLRSAPVTEVKSVGANLIDLKDVSIAENYRFDIPIKVTEGKYCLSVFNSDGTEAGWLRGTTYAADFMCNDVHIVENIEFIKTVTKEQAAQINKVRIHTNPSGYTGTATTMSVMLNKGSTALYYTPYVEHTLPIPAEVQALDGYGWGLNESVRNYIDYEKKQFVKKVEKVVIDGDETIVYTSDKFVIPDIFPKSAKIAYGICDGYEYSDAWFTALANNQITTNITGQKGVAIRDDNYTTESEFKLKLAEKPITLVYELATPEVTDISDILTTDNLIGVEDNGIITFENEYRYDVPNEVDFYEGINDVVGANTFVGDLVGTATRAIADKNGNDIATNYVKQEPVYYHQFQVQQYKNGSFVVDMWDLGTTISFNGLKCFVLNSAGERVYLSSIYTSIGSGTIYTPDGKEMSIYHDDYPELGTIYFYDKEGAEAWSGTQYEGSNGGNPITISYSRSIFDEMSISVGKTQVTETKLSVLATGNFGGLEMIGSVEQGSSDIYYDYGSANYIMINSAKFVSISGAYSSKLYPIWHETFDSYETITEDERKRAAFIENTYGSYTFKLPKEHGVSAGPMGGNITLTFYR